MSSCNGILALIGGFLIHLSLGQIYTIGNIATYLAAYVRVNTNPDYSYEAASWIYTGGVMFQGLGVPIGGLFDKRFGSRPTAALGCFLMSLGVLTSHWSIRHSSGLLFVTYGILTGLGTGLAYVAPLCCAMKWFPEHKGLVNGVVLGGYGLSGLLFNFVITVYINPDNLSVDPDTGYFTEETVLERVPNVFLVLGGAYAVLQTLGITLLMSRTAPCNYCKKGTDSPIEESQEYIDEDEQGRLVRYKYTPAPNDEEIYSLRLATPPLPYEDLSPLSVLNRWEFYMLWFSFFLNQQAIGFINTMYKAFGQTFIDDDRFLSLVGAVASAFNCGGRVLWGALLDSTSYKLSMIVASGLLAALYFSLIATATVGRALFAVWVWGIFLAFSGTFALLPTATTQAFGSAWAGSNYGLVFTNTLVSSLVTSLVIQATNGWLWHHIFFLFAAFPLLTMIITFFFPEDARPNNTRPIFQTEND